MIQQWIDRIPRFLLSVIVVVSVVVGLTLYEPKATVCEIQMQVIVKKLRKHFTYRKEDGWTYNSKVNAKYKFCIQSNSMGGCHALIQRFNYYEKQVRTIPSSCKGHESISKMEKWMIRAIQLMARLAWGTELPADSTPIAGWLDTSTVALYCRMSREYGRLYGEDKLKALENHTISKLPGVDGLYKKDRRAKTLFATSCRQYLR